MRNLKYLCFILAICSCKLKSDEALTMEDPQLHVQNGNMNSKGIKHFELDSITSPKMPGVQLFDNGSDYYLTYLNEETGRLYFNDMKTEKIVKSTLIQAPAKEVKKKIQGFYVHNLDSIFMIYFKPTVKLINQSGEIKDQYNIVTGQWGKRGKLLTSGLASLTQCHPYLVNGTLYISSYVVGDISDNEQRQVQIKLDLKSKRVNLGKVVVPKEYNDKKLAGIHYFLYSTTYNPDNQNLIYSFPASRSLYINSLATDALETKPASSKYFYTSFREYDEDEYEDAVSDKRGEFFMQNPSYANVLFDRYRNLYYRIALLPVNVKNANYEAKNAPLKQISVIVMDKNFKYLSEKLLQRNKYLSSNIFVSREGLNVQLRPVTNKTLDFETFVFQEKDQGDTEK